MNVLPKVLHTLCFEAPGLCPSKSNYRYSTARGKADWKRVKDYERSVGYAAIAAGASYAKSLYGSSPLRVILAAYNQKADLDNIWKAALDSLEGVAFVNDRQVVSQEATKVSDDYGPRIRIVIRYLGEAS